MRTKLQHMRLSLVPDGFVTFGRVRMAFDGDGTGNNLGGLPVHGTEERMALTAGGASRYRESVEVIAVGDISS